MMPATLNGSDLQDAMKRWGLALEVNQAGPLLEQMAKQWSVRIDRSAFSDRYIVSWRGSYGAGDSVLAAALDCILCKHEEMA